MSNQTPQNKFYFLKADMTKQHMKICEKLVLWLEMLVHN